MQISMYHQLQAKKYINMNGFYTHATDNDIYSCSSYGLQDASGSNYSFLGL